MPGGEIVGKKTNGCEAPWTSLQLYATVLQPLLMAYFITMYALFSHQAAVVGLGIMAIITMFLAMLAWVLAAVTDPGVFIEEYEKDLDTTHYCAVCKKQVPGLDHHCKWLNTCIGSRNYAYFYWLILNAACSYTLQIATYFVILTLGPAGNETMSKGTRVVLAFLGAAACAVPWMFYVALAGFHTYLSANDTTTYECKMNRAQKQAAARRAAKAAAEAAQAAEEENAAPADEVDEAVAMA